MGRGTAVDGHVGIQVRRVMRVEPRDAPCGFFITVKPFPHKSSRDAPCGIFATCKRKTRLHKIFTKLN